MEKERRNYIRIPLARDKALSFMPQTKDEPEPYGFFDVIRWRPYAQFEESTPEFDDEALVRFAVQVAGSEPVEGMYPRWLLPMRLLQGHSQTTGGTHTARLAARMEALREFYGDALPASDRSYFLQGIPIDIDRVILRKDDGLWRFSTRQFSLRTAVKFAHCILRDRLTAETLPKYYFDFMRFPELELLTEKSFRLARESGGAKDFGPEDALALVLREIADTLERMRGSGSSPGGDAESFAGIVPLALAEIGRPPAGSIRSARDREALLALLNAVTDKRAELQSPGGYVSMIFDYADLAAAELLGAGTKAGEIVLTPPSFGVEPPEIPLDLLIPDRASRKASAKDEPASEEGEPPAKSPDREDAQVVDEGDERFDDEFSPEAPLSGTWFARIEALERELAKVTKRVKQLEAERGRRQRRKKKI